MSVHFKTIVTTALLALAATAVHAQDIKIGYNADVDAMVGPANSGNALAWLHIPQQRKIPVVVPIATGTEITIQGSGAELRRDPRIRAAYLGEH